MLSLLRTHRLGAMLARMLDPAEFLSDHGVRSVSRFHADHPYVFEQDGVRLELAYEPGEGRTRIYGGNSNWRGPVWMPVNFLLVEALRQFGQFFGDSYQLSCLRGSGAMLPLGAIAHDLSQWLQGLEIGAGTGKFIPTLLEVGGTIIAVEPITEMREQLVQSFPNVTALAGSADAVPLPDASVDAVVCAQAFHWFATVEAVAKTPSAQLATITLRQLQNWSAVFGSIPITVRYRS